MNEYDVETMLYELLQDQEQACEVDRAVTFEEAGVLTGNRGLVIRTQDGSTFEITIVQST